MNRGYKRIDIGALLAGLFVLACGAIGLMWPQASSAADVPARWIQISPVSKKLDLTPDSQFDSSINITNIGSETFNFRVYANPYFVEDVTSDPVFETESQYTQISRWISFDQTEYSTIAPGQVAEVPYHISVPADVPGGGQYAVIFAEIINTGSDTSAIQTVSRVGSLIYAHLPGEARLQGEVVSVEQPFFYPNNPVTASTTVRNHGNVDFTMQYKYTIRSLIGEELFTDTKSQAVLPGVSARADIEWSGPAFGVGIFNVTNQVSYLESIHYDQTQMIIVCPYWLLILLIILVIAIIVSAVLLFVRAVKKRRIVKIG